MVGTTLPTTTVAAYHLGTQAWWGAEPYDPRRVTTAGWPKEARSKPGGFFTSSWNEERHTSAWIDWQATRPERASEPRYAQLLTPDPQAVLYVIDSPDDYAALVEAWPHRQHRPEPCPDWRAVAQAGRFDAIHLTAAAVTNKTLWYAMAWQVESTLWISPKLAPLSRG